MIKRADGSYSQRGLWDNIRANKGSGKKPTAEMLKQERKIKAKSKKKLPKAMMGMGKNDPMDMLSKVTGMDKNEMRSMALKLAPMALGMPPVMKKGGATKKKIIASRTKKK